MFLGLLGLAVVLGLAFVGFPLAVALGAVGVVGFALMVNLKAALAVYGQLAWDNVSNPSLAVLPLFLLMGNLISVSGMASDLYRFGYAILGRFRGGLALATIAAAGSFSAICGSSLATAATMSKVAIPEMRKYRYDPGFSGATVASGATLGILIPPSIGLIVYGLLTETNIGKLFIAGIVPGIIGIALYCVAVMAVVRLRPGFGPAGDRVARAETLRLALRVVPMVLFFVVMVAGLYVGAYTAAEAGGVAAALALVMALARRSLGLRDLAMVIRDTVVTSAMLFMLVISAMMLSAFLEVIGFAGHLNAFIVGLDLAPWVVLATVVAIYLVLGCFLEGMSMIFLTVPIFFPIVTALGYDPVWFGIIVVVAVEIGMITPPIGMNLFIVRSVAPEISHMVLWRGVIPFIAADALRLLLLLIFPVLVIGLAY